MSNGIIENAEELKNLYLQTDIADVSSVQSAIKEISENVYAIGKEKYLEALNAAIPANLSKARRYNNMVSDGGLKSTIMKNLGWVVVVVFVLLISVIDSDYEDAITTWLSLGFWAGIGIQIYIAVLKSAWNKLTLSGAVIHPALKTVSATSPVKYDITDKNITTIATEPPQKVDSANYVFCSNCGRRNKAGTQFCENCGAKL